MKQITNCGLIALRNISTLENISIRTMLYIAEDNGLKLYPYKVPLDKTNTVPLPAIFHAENHFIYVTDSSELNGYKLTGNVLLTNKSTDYFKIPAKQLNSLTGKTWAAIIVGGVSLGVGVYQKGRANKKTKEALANRKSYQTPDEVYQILNGLENRSQGDTIARDFQTQQIDNSFSQQLGVAELLGADPNDLSALFGQKMQGILQVGQQFHASNMEAFGKYLGGLDMVAQNKAAEQGSSDNLIKDQLQALSAEKAQADSLINTGINSGISGIASYATGQLYKDPNPATGDKLEFKDNFGVNSGAYKAAKKRKMSYDEYNQYFDNYYGGLQ